jgi:hypothetical protein
VVMRQLPASAMGTQRRSHGESGPSMALLACTIPSEIMPAEADTSRWLQVAMLECGARTLVIVVVGEVQGCGSTRADEKLALAK